MDLILGLGCSCRPYRVLRSAVPRWEAAERSVEMVRLAQLAPNISGNDLAGILERLRTLAGSTTPSESRVCQMPSSYFRRSCLLSCSSQQPPYFL
jgi:hypothetical protein